MPDERGSVLAPVFESRLARQLLDLPGVWIEDGQILGSDASAGEAAGEGPRYLRRLHPGAPLPDGVAPNAPRYEMVTRTEMPERLRRPAAAAGAALALGGGVTMAAGVPWGLLALLGGAALVAAAITGGMESVAFRRSETGMWVEGPPPPPEPPVRAPLLPLTARAALAVLSLAFLGIIRLRWGEIDASEMLISAGLGIAMGAVAILTSVRRLHDPVDAGERFRARFREFADPTRPLPPEVFARDPLSAAREMAEAGASPQRPASGHRESALDED